MPFWRTRIYLPYDNGCVTNQDIKFNRGIFQGESLYPLLFCLSLVTVSHMLKRARVRYMIHNKTGSHLLNIDDLTEFARN